MKNGELLQCAENDGFEVFLTGDRTKFYEQNLTGCRIAVVVLSAIEWHIIRHSLLTIQAAIDSSTPGSHVRRTYRMFETVESSRMVGLLGNSGSGSVLNLIN